MEAEETPPFKLLFHAICEHAPAVEQDAIKRALGQDLVEQNELLLAEYSALIEIAGAFEEETTALHTQRQEAQKLLIPDRERHLRNIQFFIEHINGGGKPGGRPRTGPLPLAANAEEQAVVDFVTAELELPPSSASAPGSPPAMVRVGSMRPSTARSRKCLTPRPMTAPATAERHASASRVRVVDIDDTKRELKQLLQEENEMLLQQVELVRLGLEDAADFRQNVVEAPVPSVKEIKDFEHKLERMSVAPQQSLVDIMERHSSPAPSPKAAQVQQVDVASESLSPVPPPAPRQRKEEMHVASSLQGGRKKEAKKQPKAFSIDCSAPLSSTR